MNGKAPFIISRQPGTFVHQFDVKDAEGKQMCRIEKIGKTWEIRDQNSPRFIKLLKLRPSNAWKLTVQFFNDVVEIEAIDGSSGANLFKMISSDGLHDVLFPDGSKDGVKEIGSKRFSFRGAELSFCELKNVWQVFPGPNQLESMIAISFSVSHLGSKGFRL